MKQQPGNKPANPCVLTINGGSSTIRFAMYPTAELRVPKRSGIVSRIGLNGTELRFRGPTGADEDHHALPQGDYTSAIASLLDRLQSLDDFSSIIAVGHRVVHGMQHAAPLLITAPLLDELRRISPYAPEHLPGEIELIEALQARHPSLPQVACFDTAFHHDMPRVARLLAIPRRYAEAGVVRYGFHGLSYSYLMEELDRLGDPAAKSGRVILAHLGNGASLAAVRDGRSIDTSMGFTPTAGLPMSTRSGDLDPGLVSYLARTEAMDPARFHEMVNHESGLLGVSQISSDMRDLLEREADDERAADAIALFCYQVRKWIGAFAATLNGLDTLVFAGGIGENAPAIRARICEGLTFLGLSLDNSQNAESAAVVSTVSSRVTVRVIRTDEEQMIARATCRVIESA